MVAAPLILLPPAFRLDTQEDEDEMLSKRQVAYDRENARDLTAGAVAGGAEAVEDGGPEPFRTLLNALCQ